MCSGVHLWLMQEFELVYSMCIYTRYWALFHETTVNVGHTFPLLSLLGKAGRGSTIVSVNFNPLGPIGPKVAHLTSYCFVASTFENEACPQTSTYTRSLLVSLGL